MKLEEQVMFLNGLKKGDLFVAEPIQNKEESRMIEWSGKSGMCESGIIVGECRMVKSTGGEGDAFKTGIYLVDDNLRKPTNMEEGLFHFLEDLDAWGEDGEED